MPRPVKLRNVCCLPKINAFVPMDHNFRADCIVMTVDEYETIRLIDLEGLTQEECSKQMNVARTTVQGIYNEARRKLAEFLVNGKKLRIEGGEYKICNGAHKSCHCGCLMNNNKEEVNEMYIAIPADENNENSTICMSYGRTPYFAIYDVQNEEFTFLDNSAVACSGGAGIVASQTLVDKKVNIVITQRLGQNAADVLKAANIKIIKGNQGTIKENIKYFLEDKLEELTNIHPGFHNHGVNQ